MSQIRKSASFRSRIPIRRAKPVPRRCYSPEPYRNLSTPAMYDQSHNNDDYDTKPMCNHHGNEQRISKQKMKRQRHIATTLAQQAQHTAKPSNDASITSVSNFPVAPIRPKTIYSSSSYSSSDESQESEAPPQYLLKQSASSAAIVRPPLNVSTDAMSLDGILDSISCGSISSPPSPANYLSRGDSYSSCDSLDKYNYALETLKLSDSGNYFKGNMLQPKCRQPYVHNDRKMDTEKLNDDLITPKLPPRPPLPKISQSSTTIDKDLAKQQQLSDWYYIKTGPKSPLPTPRTDKRNGIYGSTTATMTTTTSSTMVAVTPTPANRTTTNILNNNSNTVEEIYGKNGNSRESTKNHLNVYSENMMKRVENGNSRFSDIDHIQMATIKTNGHDDNHTTESVYQTINVPSSCDDLQKIHTPLNHQYSGNEPLCKFNLRNNSEQVNGCPKWQQPQEIQQRIHMMAPPSPSVLLKKVHSHQQHHQQSHPFYYVEPSKKHLSSPRQDKHTKQSVEYQQKLPEPQCEQIQVASKLQTHNERLSSAAIAATPATVATMTSNSNSNIHKVSGVHSLSHQQTDHCDNANSSSFEHVNVTSGFSSLSASSEMTIDDKRQRFNNQNYADEQCFRSSTNVVGDSRQCLQQTVSSSPLLPATVGAHPAKLYPPKSTSYRSDCELFGSYVSLDCPSPPAPPVCLTDARRDPQARLSRYLKMLYTEWALKEPNIPTWTNSQMPGALSPARLEPEFRLHSQSHGFSDLLTVDQLLTPIQTKDGQILEAPRRLIIECPHWVARHFLAMRILHAWAKEPPWPARGVPVAVALYLPLVEMNNKKSIAHFVEKELISKGPNNPFASGFGGFSSAWNSLSALGPKLLIVIDGYDIVRSSPKRKAKNIPQDIIDLLEGKIFPESRIIIISTSQNIVDILPLVQRHVKYEGLTWGKSVSLLSGGQWRSQSRFLETVQRCVHLRNVARTPLGCLALATGYEISNGDLPTDEIDVVESIMNWIASDATQTQIAELGRLALFSLKTKRTTMTTTEIKMYCSNPESSILNCLEKAQLFGKTAKKKNEHIFTPICVGIIELLAANYIASLANRPGLLAAEITGLSLNDEVEPEILKVLTFAMSLLGPRAHILLSKLTPLWLSPQTVFSLALSGGDSTANLNALCDLLGISKTPSISPLETNPIWVQIRSTPVELQGWAMALKSQNSTLKNLELNYQIDKHTFLESRNSLDIFLDALSFNESVSTLRITSLIENDAKEIEMNVIANCVSRCLLKPRLENFELILTLLEEDPPMLKLQSVVTALCRALPHQPKVTSMLLDLGLFTSQLVQICSVLETCPNVTRLSLPHLRCERGAVVALASLLKARPLASLALPSCWGVRDDLPSSSGVSMSSGSGSSTGTSAILKQSTLTNAPSPRSFQSGIFSSLPRGALMPVNPSGRSATLPRQPLDLPPDKRSSDSVVSKTWYPTPACDGGPHNSGTLHDLLLAVREPYSRLHGLDLSKAQLSLEDSMCLGETVRVSTQLHSIKLEGSSRMSEVLPTLLGCGESISLQMMSLASTRLVLEDGATAMSSRALANCGSLRLLSLDGWTFRVDNSTTFSAIRAFLTFTSIRELGLSNCRLHLPAVKIETISPFETYECRSVVVLKMAGAQVFLADNNILRGPQLLPYLSGFPCLRELDLSGAAKSGLGSSTSTPFILDDKCIIAFFHSLHTHFSMLNTLKMCNWIIHLDDASKTMKTVSKALRNSPLSHVKIDGISVLDRSKKTRIEPAFFHMLLSSLNSLRWFGCSLAGKKDDQITAIGNAVLDIRGNEIDIRLSESTIDGARLMAQAISLDVKFDVRVSTFGTSSGILIHAEKMSNKSLNRKN